MNDPHLPSENDTVQKFQKAIQAMSEGYFKVDIPVDPDEPLGQLGASLAQLAQQLETRFEHMERLKEVSENVTAGVFLDDLMNRVYDSFRSLIPYNRIGLALLSQENTVLTAHWGRSDSLRIKLKAGYSCSMAGSSLQTILETGEPRILNDLEAYLLEHPQSASTRLIVDEGMRSSLTCPLLAQGKAVGFIFFSSSKPGTYGPLHKGLFLQLAGQVSNLVEKSRLYQQIFDLNQKLMLMQKALEEQATHDALTGLWNRRAILDHFENYLSRARRQQSPISILMLDVDHFKRFNDTFGHLAGDYVLEAVAQVLQRILREYDFVGRYGGEEFLVVLGDTDENNCQQVAERLRMAIEETEISYQGHLLKVTMSLGAAIATPTEELSSQTLLSLADAALYRAKDAGRNRVEFSLWEKPTEQV